MIDVDVIPCRDALNGIPGHPAHDRFPDDPAEVVVCPGTFLHEFDLRDRPETYRAITRIAQIVGVGWPTMANSIAAVQAAEPGPATATDAAAALLAGRDQ